MQVYVSQQMVILVNTRWFASMADTHLCRHEHLCHTLLLPQVESEQSVYGVVAVRTVLQVMVEFSALDMVLEA